ncbi:MAG TPA: hypothetical protein VMW38_23275, partial [Terriglobia bacterium]|nr:hypothetical protein [Terriglobia bacterium]
TDGEIVVPAGSKVIGKLEQADRSGHVSVRFTEINLPDGASYGIDARALALDFGPLKGEVGGRRNLARFVARAATGLGVVAAQVVGMHGRLNGPIDNSVLIRDRLTGNIAQAGDQQLQQMAISSNPVVTVPAN